MEFDKSTNIDPGIPDRLREAVRNHIPPARIPMAFFEGLELLVVPSALVTSTEMGSIPGLLVTLAFGANIINLRRMTANVFMARGQNGS